MSEQSIVIRGKEIVINGQPTQIRSGAMHYFRILPEQWHDRLLNLKRCGLNTVETYMAWNVHEAQEGHYDFSGRWDVAAFLREAQALGLMAIVRPGPYICSEWDFGGLPAWLLSKPDMRIRCMNKDFLTAADRFLKNALDILTPLQWPAGGPVIMMQIENEYGSVGNDIEYLQHLYDLFRQQGVTVPLFISDSPSEAIYRCGALPSTLLTVNCRNHPCHGLDLVQRLRPNSPDFVMELWSGVSACWGESYYKHAVEDVAADVESLLKRRASFNFYMFHGGTSFGFMPGARLRSEKGYQPFLNSYEVDAPMDEAGNPTPKYTMIRDLIKKYCPDAETGEPIVHPARDFGRVQLDEHASLWDALPALSRCHKSVTPESMEHYGQNHGFILYRTQLDLPRGVYPLSIERLCDRAQVYSNGQFCGDVFRNDNNQTVNIHPGQLDILVENLGRVNAGMGLQNDWRKGMTGAHVHSRRLYHWEVYPLPLDDLSGLRFQPSAPTCNAPTFYRGRLNVDNPADTYLRVPYGSKGVVWINGFNLGRYWHIGPQFALYLPAPLLRQGDNDIIILELAGLREPIIECIDHPDFAAPQAMIL
ncbi:MAG: beta-galactosidase [Lentisphaerae bacterium]|jgi:beta-galactosidase|nr:beta-galactosidase [Lentisphaerota bacterium]